MLKTPLRVLTAALPLYRFEHRVKALWDSTYIMPPMLVVFSTFPSLPRKVCLVNVQFSSEYQGWQNTDIWPLYRSKVSKSVAFPLIWPNTIAFGVRLSIV